MQGLEDCHVRILPREVNLVTAPFPLPQFGDVTKRQTDDKSVVIQTLCITESIQL